MKKNALTKVTFSSTSEEIINFTSILKEMIKFNNNFKMVMNDEGIIMYAIIADGNNIAKIDCAKTYVFENTKLFKNLPVLNIELVFGDVKELYNKLSLYTNTEVEICISYRDNLAYDIIFSSKKLKIKSVFRNIKIKTINFDIINTKFNLVNTEIVIDVNLDTFNTIKKLAKTDNSEYFNITSSENKINIIDETWELTLSDNYEKDNFDICIDKKFFNLITFSDKNIKIGVYDTYIVIDNNNSYLIIALTHI